MEEYYWILRRSPLFDGADEKAVSHILHCMEAYVSSYGKGEIICHYGDCIPYAGIVLEGRVELVVPGSDGRESSIRIAGKADSFGCSHACMPKQPSYMTVIAKKKTKILFLKLAKLFCPEAIGCRFASLLTANLLKQTAGANLQQNRRIHIMSQKSIREKLFMLLEQSGAGERDGRVELSMNRQELADYLGVERSALSREMARMKKQGLIDYHRSEIVMCKALETELRARA